MFKRFMILCWVLLFFSTVVAAGASFVYFPSKSKVDQARSTYGAYPKYEVIRRIEERIEEENKFVATYREYERRKVAGTWTGSDWSSPDMIRKVEKAREQITALWIDLFRFEDAYKLANNSEFVLAVSGIAALFLLAWNTIWHLGQWIRTGEGIKGQFAGSSAA